MLQFIQRKNSRIFILVLATVTALSAVSNCTNLEERLISKNIEEAAKIESESSYTDDQDADVFVAEIFPVGVGNFEQIFHPLARYKKAVLGLDAEIEPFNNSQDRRQVTSEAFVVDPVKTQSKALPNSSVDDLENEFIIVNSSHSPEKRNRHNEPSAKNTSIANVQDNLDNVPLRGYRYLNSNSQASFQKQQQQTGDLVGNGKQAPMLYVNTTDEEDLTADSSGSGINEGSGSNQTENTKNDNLRIDEHKMAKINDGFYSSDSSKNNNESQSVPLANETLQSNIETDDNYMINETLKENYQAVTGHNISNASKYDSPVKVSTTYANTKSKSIFTDFESRTYNTEGMQWQSKNHSWSLSQNIVRYKEADEHNTNAKNITQYETSNMRAVHKLENNALLAPVDSLFKKHGGVNEQSVNMDEGSGEYTKENINASEGSGDSIPEVDDQRNVESLYNQSSSFSINDRNGKNLNPEKAKQWSNIKGTKIGEGDSLRTMYFTNSSGNNTPFFTREMKYNFAPPNDKQTGIKILSTNNTQAAARFNTTKIPKAFQGDLRHKSTEVMNETDEPSENKSYNGKVENTSENRANTMTSINPHGNDVIEEEGRNEVRLVEGDNNHNYKPKAGNVTEYAQNQKLTNSYDVRKDMKSNFVQNTKWTEKNEEKFIDNRAGKKSQDGLKSQTPRLQGSARMESRLSRGEAARKLFLSSLSTEDSEQPREQTPKKHGNGYIDKNLVGAREQEAKSGGDVQHNMLINTFQSVNKDFGLANGYSNEKVNDDKKSSSSRWNRKGTKEVSKIGSRGEDFRLMNQNTINNFKSYHKSDRFRTNNKRTHKKKNFSFLKAGNSNKANFITMMMSLKARELYKNLIHDTSKALMSKKHHQKKGYKHQLTRMRPALRDESQETTDKLTSTGKHQMQYFGHKKDSLKPHGETSTRSNEMRKLTNSLLHTMTENGHQLIEQTKFSPIKASDRVDIKDSMPEKLDSPHSLIEKLAELRYANGEQTKEEEVPIPQAENAEDTSSRGPEFEKENPGKTVLQRQSKVGLGTDINMDSLDGRKQGYEFKSLDAEIEGELAKNAMMTENNKESSIGNLTSNQLNTDIRNITDSAIRATPIPSALSLYNEEEMLERGPEQYQLGVDISNEEKSHKNESMGELKASNTLTQKGNMSNHYEGKTLSQGTPNGHFGKQLKKENLQRRPTMYFSGNSSLWKHHPYVSMDIMPLVDIFYKVNHKNLIDLVKEEEEGDRIEKMRQNHSFQMKKINRKMISAEKTLHKHKSSKRKKVKKDRHKLKTGSSNMRRKHKHKNRGAKFSLHKVEPVNDMMSRKTTTKFEDGKKYSKTESKRIQRKYKHKNKKHVKGTAKFGISQMKQGPNPPEIPVVKDNMPSDVQYYKIENAGRYGAVCIDGSTPGYFFREGKGPDSNKWIIHLHGGAWCYDAETCFRRSYSILGSSNNWSAENITNFFQGILSKNKEINPYFNDWNVVVQSYCDGGLFSGRRKRPLVHRGRKLYFRGRQILKAMVESLKRRNLQKASDIVLSGTSAGGLAVLLQGDYLKHRLPKTALVRGLVDAGFFLNSQAEDGTNIIGNQFRGLYDLHNPKLRKACEREQNNSTKFLCLFPENTLQQNKLPIYFINALYDHWQLSELQQVHCVYHNDQCMTTERDRILNFRKVMFSRLNDAIKHLPNAGLFADSCIGHGQAIVDYTWSRIRVNNSTLRDAFDKWLRDVHGEKRHFNVDCHFPCNGSCPRAMVNLCIKNFEGASISHRTRRNAELC